ncbi:hypothetical protein DSO57_1021027 [Entomophthora muscae]|uniref:Uncharacterized protein n=1 Tax=Entomophthora muscae TaxID=34485 RepID=A0ACC2RUR3_9FUNG|nr:hypothetical protein DSO57_1021027 [Entomophthora muscae]
MLNIAGAEDIPDENSLWRQWLYQCCTEFGYWQVAPPKEHKAARSRAATYDDWDRLFCGDVYGKSFRQGPDVNATNSHYLGKKLDSDNIFWVNGELDPWMPLSVTSRSHHHPRPFVIRNASHAMDLSADHPLDWDDLVLAKSLIKRHIAHWVKPHHMAAQQNFHSIILSDHKLLFIGLALSVVAIHNIFSAIRNNVAAKISQKS